MKILITGASGFVGKAAAERFIGAQHQVVGLGRRAFKMSLGPNFNYLQAKYDSTDELTRQMDGADIVLHCAGKAGAWGSYGSYYDANVTLTSVVLSSAKAAGVKRFINISSPSIFFDYCDQFGLVETDLPSKFSNPYAETKYLAEQRVAAAHGTEFQTISFRPRGIMGKGDTNWLPRIIDLFESNRLRKPAGKNPLVNFTSIENLLDAIELAINAPAQSMGATYNIHNGVDEALWDVVSAALRALGHEPKIKSAPLPLMMGIAKASESWAKLRGAASEPKLLPIKVGVASYSMTMSIEKAQKMLGFKPKYSTEDAIRQFCEWQSLG